MAGFPITKPGSLLWKSDFNSHNVQMGKPFIAETQWWQDVIGVDPLPGLEDTGSYQFSQPDTVPDPTVYVQQHFTNVIGHNNTKTRCIAQLVFGDPPGNPDNTRSNWYFTPSPSYTEFYQSWWMYLQPNTLTIMDPTPGTFNFRQIWENKMGVVLDTDFRYGVTLIYQQSLGGFHWQTNADDMGNGGAWQVLSPVLPTDFGRWVYCEVYVKFHVTTGRVIFNFDNRNLCNFTGKTKHVHPAHHWKITTLYTGLAAELKGYHWQFVDDVEIWGKA